MPEQQDNTNELLHTMRLIIDSITKDSAEQQRTLAYGDVNTYINEGIFREVDGEFVLDMYLLKGLDYSNLDTMMLLMPENYTEVNINEEDEKYLGLDVDGAIGKVLDTFPSIEGFHVRYFKLPDYAYLSVEDGGIETSLLTPVEGQDADVISNYVDREYFEELMEYDNTFKLYDLEELGELGELEELDELQYLDELEGYQELDTLDELRNLYGEDESEEYIPEEGYISEGEFEEDVTIDLYLFDGVDLDKVEQDNIDLEDTENYEKINMTEEELLEIGVDVDAMLSQLGIPKADGVVNVKVLPSEYYLMPEEGGYPYPHLKDESKPENLSDKSLEMLKAVEDFVIGDYEEWFAEMEQEVGEEIGMDIRQVNEKVVHTLEKVRKTRDEDKLHQLDVKLIENLFTEYSNKPLSIRGYYVTTDEEFGVRTKTIHFMLDIEGIEDVWVFSYTGVYKSQQQDEVFEVMDEHLKESNEFNLERVVNLPKEELDQLIADDLG